MATKKKTKRKKPQAPSAKNKPLKKSKVSKKIKNKLATRTPKVKKQAKKIAAKTVKRPLKVQPSKTKKAPIKKAKKNKPVKLRSIKTKVVKKPTRKKVEIRTISEELFAPNVGDFLKVKKGAYRYRITKLNGEKVITRSLKTYLALINDEVQKINLIKEKIKKKKKLTGTYGRIFPPTKRNERRDGSLSSINADFSGHPLKDIDKKTFDEFKNKK